MLKCGSFFSKILKFNKIEIKKPDDKGTGKNVVKIAALLRARYKVVTVSIIFFVVAEQGPSYKSEAFFNMKEHTFLKVIACTFL